MYIGPKTIFPPPSQNDNFEPSPDCHYLLLTHLVAFFGWLYFKILTSIFSLSFPFLRFLFHIFSFFLVTFSHFLLQKTSANVSLWEWGKFPIHKNTSEGLAHDHHGLNVIWQAYTLSQKQSRCPRI
jgi:hypothetical protein